MAGLEKHFASTMPHHSIGATANGRTGVYTTPAVSAGNYRARSFLSPAVSMQHSVGMQFNLTSHERMHTTFQGRPSYRSAPVAGRQWGSTPQSRGRQPIGLINEEPAISTGPVTTNSATGPLAGFTSWHLRGFGRVAARQKG